MGRPSEGPSPPGDGIIILPPGNGEVPPPVIPSFNFPERGEIVVSIEADLRDAQFLVANTFNRGEALRVNAEFTLNFPWMIRVVRAYQFIDPNQVPSGLFTRRAIMQPDGTGGLPLRFDVPFNGPVGTWHVEISVFLEIDGQRVYPIAFPVTLAFEVL